MSESEEFCVQEHDDVQIAVIRRKQLRLCQTTTYNDQIRDKHGKKLFDYLALIERELNIYKKKVKLEADFSSCITNVQLDNLKNICHKNVVGISEEVFKLLENKVLENLKKVLEENTDFERYEASLRLNFALEKQDNFYRERRKILVARFKEKFKNDRLKYENYFQSECKKILDQIIADCDWKINQVRLFLDAKAEKKDNSTVYEKQKKQEGFQFLDEVELTDGETQYELGDEKLDLKNLQSKIVHPSELCDFTHLLCDYNFKNESFVHTIKETYFNNLTNLKLYFLDWYDRRPEDECKCDWSASKLKINNLFSYVLKKINSTNINNQNSMADFIRSADLVIPNEVTEKLFCTCESVSGVSCEENNPVESSEKIVRNESHSSLSAESYSSATTAFKNTEPKRYVSKASLSKTIAPDPEALNNLKSKLKQYLVKTQDHIMESFNTRFLIGEILGKKMLIKNSSEEEIENCLISAVKEKVHEIVNQFGKDSASVTNLCLWQPSESDNVESEDSKVEPLPTYMRTKDTASTRKILPKNFIFKEVSKDEFTRILLYPHCILSSESNSVHASIT